MTISISIPIIAYLRSPYREKFGIPRQPNLVDVQSKIYPMAPYNNPQAFDGIEQFSHLWLLWHFHDNKHQQENASQFRPQIRPPRLGGNQKIGVFASRSMYRPAPIGLSVVRFLGIDVDEQGLFLSVSGADLLDGTPIIDIKPYLSYADAIVDAHSGYAQDVPVQKSVFWQDNAEQQKQLFLQQGILSSSHIIEIEQILSLDPRPAYQHDAKRIYAMRYAQFDVQFKIHDCVEIVGLFLLGD